MRLSNSTAESPATTRALPRGFPAPPNEVLTQVAAASATRPDEVRTHGAADATRRDEVRKHVAANTSRRDNDDVALLDWRAERLAYRAMSPASGGLFRACERPPPKATQPGLQPLAERLHAVWSDRGQFLQRLNSLPRTFCHRDTYRPNLVLRPADSNLPVPVCGQAPAGRPGPREDVVLLDWAYAGPGPIGTDAASLAWTSLLWFHVDADPPAFQQLVFGEYVRGLRETGWSGPESQARDGFILSGVLRWITGRHSYLIATLQQNTLEEQRRASVERDWGRSFDEAVARWREITEALLDLADQVRRR